MSTGRDGAYPEPGGSQRHLRLRQADLGAAVDPTGSLGGSDEVMCINVDECVCHRWIIYVHCMTIRCGLHMDSMFFKVCFQTPNIWQYLFNV